MTPHDHDGRPPLSSFDHAPDVGASDVDKCRECGRHAPHAFDHAPECTRFESIDDELAERTAASNDRMAVPATDGGTDAVTVYRIGRAFETTDPDVAEAFSRRGSHVTASTSRAAPER